nr:hypothetical protein [Tanacetum cinerariifolium]
GAWALRAQALKPAAPPARPEPAAPVGGTVPEGRTLCRGKRSGPDYCGRFAWFQSLRSYPVRQAVGNKKPAMLLSSPAP